MISERKKLENFIDFRSDSIGKLDSGEIDRDEFSLLNTRFIQSLGLNPFSQIEKYEEGLYNYQYYNLLAKEALYCAEESRKKGDLKKEKYFLNKKDNYYYLKDQATFKILSICKDENIQAYYINTNSNSLRGKLYEIVLEDREKCILHSMNQDILDLLKKRNIFNNLSRDSKINEYVNNR